jgi:hypothetical protein
MRALGIAIVTAFLSCGPSWGEDARSALSFAWPPRADAQVELTDERSVGDDRQSIVLTMRLRVEPDPTSGRVVVRLFGVQLASIDGSSPRDTDPARTLLAVGRVMKRITPTMVIGRDGRYLETRDLEPLVREVLGAVGFPAMPPDLSAFSALLSDVAATDWNTWVGAWLGNRLAPGEREESEQDMQLDGAMVPVRLTRRGLTPSVADGRTRLEASAVYPSESVRQYTRGFLVDMAREAKELGDNDPVASVKFVDSARYSPMTETRTVELETATMLPLFAERTRSFTAVKGKHKVEGRERRTHRFTWIADNDVRALD